MPLQHKGKEEEETTSTPSPSQNGMQIVFQKLCTPNKQLCRNQAALYQFLTARNVFIKFGFLFNYRIKFSILFND